MTSKAVTQRDYMRRFSIEMGTNKEKVCAAYAQAERDGLVPRKRNENGLPAEDYAVALWNDGIRRGWLTGP